MLLIVYFGETDQVNPWQTDHLFSWRMVAVNAVGLKNEVQA